MRRRTNCALLLVTAFLLLSGFSLGQESTSQRKLVNREAPQYPALARNIRVNGVVKVDVLVAPDGSVKSVDLRGGHPLLAQAALDAVRRWKWEPGAHESHVTVEVKFAPQ